MTTETTTHLTAQYLAAKHEAGLGWDEYLAIDPDKAEPWRKFYDQVSLTADQQTLLSGFKREMKVIGLSGIWCGDCAQQGPLIQRIADGSETIDLCWLEREDHEDLADLVMINAGKRVPVLIFCAEDFEPVSVYGDRTLTRYRAMAQRQLGGACPLPGAPVPDDELAATLQDWLNEFERVQILLRLSGRLRQKHGD